MRRSLYYLKKEFIVLLWMDFDMAADLVLRRETTASNDFKPTLSYCDPLRGSSWIEPGEARESSVDNEH